MKNRILILAICIFLAIPLNVEAMSISPLISYQGILKDSSGNLINNTVSLTFKIFNHSTSGSLLWQETKDVQVNNGLFTTQLGDVSSMNPAQFDQALWLEIVVGANTLSPRQQLMGAPYAFSLAPGAIVTGDKIANGSIAAVKLAFDPATQSELDSHNHNGKYADSNQSCLVGKVVTGIDTNGKLICGDNPLEARLAALENKLNGVNRSGNNLSFNGMNVRITSGSGATGGAINGLGNLIIGYNELRGGNDNRSGSHNLILGSYNNYRSYGGLVAGSSNEISGVYATVSGGNANIASNSSSSVSGGSGNTASAAFSSVSGGVANIASGYQSSVSGGRLNIASSYFSSVSGGKSNTASGWSSSVSGGRSNIASGEESSVSGGISRSAIGWGNWAAGGLFQDT